MVSWVQMALSSLSDKRIMASPPTGLNVAPPAYNAPKPPAGPAMPPLAPRGPTAPAGAPSAAQTAATASLAKPMDQARAEANGGSLPSPEFRFGDNRPMLGSMSMTNLQPRAGGDTMLPRPAGGAATAPQSAAGFTSYFDEKTGGAPQATRRGRAGLRFTAGPSRGKTADQAKVSLREQYARLSPEEKARYEGKANLTDISSPSQAPVAAPAAVPGAPGASPGEVMQATPFNPAAEIKSLTNEDLDLDKELAMKRRLPIKPMLPRTMMA